MPSVDAMEVPVCGRSSVSTRTPTNGRCVRRCPNAVEASVLPSATGFSTRLAGMTLQRATLRQVGLTALSGERSVDFASIFANLFASLKLCNSSNSD